MIRNDDPQGILFSLQDHLELVDNTGRITRDDKRGSIASTALPILKRLNLDPERWYERATAFEETYLNYREPRRRAA